MSAHVSEPELAAAAPPEPKKSDHATAQAALADLIAPARTLMFVGRILGALSAVLAVVPYITLVQVGDELLSAARSTRSPDASRIESSLFLLLSTFFGRVFLYFIALLCTHIADVKLNRSIRQRMLAAIGRAPLSWFSDRTSGMVRKSLQDDVTALHVMVAHKPVDYIVAIVMPISLLTYAFALNWRLGLLAISLVVIYLLSYAVMLRGMGDKTVELDRRLDQVSGTMIEFISGINVVKAFGTVGKAHQRYTRQAEETNDFYYAWVKPMLRSSTFAAAIVAAPMMLLVTFGGGAWLVAAGLAHTAEVVTVAVIALLLPQAIETFGNQSWGQQMAGGAATRIKRIIDTEILESAPHSRATPRGHEVILDDVSFAYGDIIALDQVSLRLPEGSVTALIGPSGSGKSTLATMVARFHDPSSGTIRIGGVDIRDLSETDLFARVGFVLQSTQLLTATIRENIALAKPDASDAAIAQAAEAAQIHHEIEALPNGYDTVLGTDTQLSGGQAQRISIARAILADRPILLLDEATAMTDPDCEADIQRALTQLVRGKTVLVIAHRPASVRGADQIVVLDGGKVVAAGTHDELLDQPHYREILRSTAASQTKETT